MNEPEWIEDEVATAIHQAQLAEHGGLPGIRDQGLLESVMARPKHLFAYSLECTIRELAAAYIVGIGKNHAIVDGSKRVAWFVDSTFLEIYGYLVTADEQDVVEIMLGVADGSITEAELTDWLGLPAVTAAL